MKTIFYLSFHSTIAVHMFSHEMTFGRSSKCNFTYLGEEHGISSFIGSISSKHFTIHNCVENVYLEDHSTLGTFVNGTRVTVAPNGKKQVLLQSGDRISVVMDNGPGKKFSLFFSKS
jgi:predicted component of type VI protein secretion system